MSDISVPVGIPKDSITVRHRYYAMGRHCFYTEVKEGKLEEYLAHHDNIWPEVVAGLRVAGVTELTIFNVPGTNRLVMHISTSGDLDLGKALGPGSKYREDPKCRQWEEMMDADFHGGWTEMHAVHSSDREWNKALDLSHQTD